MREDIKIVRRVLLLLPPGDNINIIKTKQQRIKLMKEGRRERETWFREKIVGDRKQSRFQIVKLKQRRSISTLIFLFNHHPPQASYFFRLLSIYQSVSTSLRVYPNLFPFYFLIIIYLLTWIIWLMMMSLLLALQSQSLFMSLCLVPLYLYYPFSLLTLSALF